MSNQVLARAKNGLPGFDVLPPFNIVRGWLAGGAALSRIDASLDDLFDESYKQMSSEEKDSFDARLREISDMFGSGGP